MQIDEKYVKILKNVLRNDIAIEKEQLKRLEAIKNKSEDEDKEFIEMLLNSNHYTERIKELALKEEVLNVLEGNKEV